MEDNSRITHVMLLAGPYAGTYPALEMQQYKAKGALRIPVRNSVLALIEAFKE